MRRLLSCVRRLLGCVRRLHRGREQRETSRLREPAQDARRLRFAPAAVLERVAQREPALRLRHWDDQHLARLDLLEGLQAVGAQDGLLGHAVGAGDLRQRLALLDLVLGEAEALGGPQRRVGLLERDLRPLGQPNGPAAGRRAKAAQLRVQIAHRLEGRARRLGDGVQIGRVGHRGLFDLPRLLELDVEAEALGVLRDQRRGDELGHVVLGLGAQRAALAHHPPEVARALLADGLVDLSFAGVVARPGEIPVAVEALLQVSQIVRGGERALERVAALVDPEVGQQAVAAAGADDELPHARGLRERVGIGVEAALDHRQVDQIDGHALLLEHGTDERQEAAAPREPVSEVLAGVGLEEADVRDHGVVQLDGNVVLGAQLVFGDALELGEPDRLGRSCAGGIGERRAVERGAQRGGEIAHERVVGVEADRERIARTRARRLRQETGLLLGAADGFQLFGAAIDLGLRVGVVGRGGHLVAGRIGGRRGCGVRGAGARAGRGCCGCRAARRSGCGPGGGGRWRRGRNFAGARAA